MNRFASVYKIKQDRIEDYLQYHADVWPEVLEMICACNIRNYTIFHKYGFMFSYFEYVGDNYEVDMAKMAADPKTQEWWAIMNPMEDLSGTAIKGEMDEIFHLD
jgi:L-rhamnose mutarotase